jgi:hypothetical protein
MLREEDACRLAAELHGHDGVVAHAHADVGPYWTISVTLSYATYADRRPVHFVISDREHAESCARGYREGDHAD